MSNTAEYRRYAAECLRLANENPNNKMMLLEMAQKWRELAQKADPGQSDQPMQYPSPVR
jgi:hypothetical protein